MIHTIANIATAIVAAGLIWGLVADNFHVKIFFLTCIIVAGLYGAATASKKILYIQTLPALIALVLLHIR